MKWSIYLAEEVHKNVVLPNHLLEEFDQLDEAGTGVTKTENDILQGGKTSYDSYDRVCPGCWSVG